MAYSFNSNTGQYIDTSTGQPVGKTGQTYNPNQAAVASSLGGAPTGSSAPSTSTTGASTTSGTQYTHTVSTNGQQYTLTNNIPPDQFKHTIASQPGMTYISGTGGTGTAAGTQTQKTGTPAPASTTSTPAASGNMTPGDPRYWMQPGSGNMATFSMGGQTKQVDPGDWKQVGDLIDQGWSMMSSAGKPFKVVNYQGGKMFQNPDTGQWSPMNVALGSPNWIPEQQAEMSNFNTWIAKGGDRTPGPSGLTQNLENPNLPLVPHEELGPTPQIAGSLSGAGMNAQGRDILGQTSDLTKQVTDAIGGQYSLAQQNMPQAQAAQMQQSQVPQVQGTQMQLSDQVKQMLTGTLGYDPSILAKMKGNAVDAVAAQGGSMLNQANRAAEQAGLGGGGASQAQAQDIARQTGAASNQAQNAIDIANAGVAQQNFQSGVGYQQNQMQDNFQMANQMALENASKLFQSIQQNTANTQQANMANASAAQNLNAQSAQQKSAFDASQGNMYNSANTQQAMNALTGNTQNAINTQLNQAQLNRQQAITNLGSQQNQWQTANTLMSGFAPVNQFNPQQSFSPLGSSLQGVGTGLMSTGQKNILGGTQ